MGKRRYGKGPRKAYLKRFAADNIHTGSTRVDRTWLENSVENAEKHKHGELIQGEGLPDLWFGGPTPRSVVLGKLNEAKNALEQGPRFQKLSDWKYAVLLNTKKQEVRMYFYVNEYFIVELDKYLEKIRRSTIFHNKEKLLAAYKMGVITWVETHKNTPSVVASG